MSQFTPLYVADISTGVTGTHHTIDIAQTTLSSAIPTDTDRCG